MNTVTIEIPEEVLISLKETPETLSRELSMLAAVKLWAVGHLLSNGELNAVILFVGFLAYAVFSRIMCKRRGDNGAGDAIPNVKWDIVSLVVGIGAYVALIMGLHTVIAGVAIA